jgi:serine/threonine protein kinase/TolB-like protein/Tfp pilus assembly protein PilF
MIGRTISHYKILEKLGEGGMGVVYKAEDTTLQRAVALKFLSSGQLRESDAKQRFMREARTAAALSHPHICTIHEIGEHKGDPFIAMEFIDGSSLRDMIETGPFKLEDAVKIAVQAAAGLAAAHEQGIVHRDIKSANIMIDKDGHAKIMDFGLAKSSGRTQLTREGTTLGTIAYMSPEQAQGHAIDHRSDIWSLGVVLYEMIAGVLPFRGEYEQAIVYSIINNEAEPLTAIRTGVPLELERIVNRCLAKDPGERYQTAKDLAADLRRFERLQSGSSLHGRAETEKSRRRGLIGYQSPMNRWLWLLILCVPAIAFLIISVIVPRYFSSEVAKPGAKVKMLAVLPFENLGPPGEEYFADGITEELIARLAKIEGLGVIARTTVMQYKQTDKTINEIGEELGVDYILEGTIRWQRLSGEQNRVRITPQLVRVSDETHLWAEVYQRDMTDIFAVQSDIAGQVARAMDIALLDSGDKKRHESNPTDNIEAYQAYLEGRFWWNKRSQEGFDKAIQLFNEAIRIDPEYALAYAGKAECYSMLSIHLARPAEYWEIGRAAAKKALELDDSLPQAYSALGWIAWLDDYDHETAENHFKHAIQLNPGYATAYNWYGVMLACTDRDEEAVQYMTRAQQLDPGSLIINRDLACVLSWVGRLDEAERQVQKTIAMDPNFSPAHAHLGRIYVAKGMYEEALAEFEIIRTIDREYFNLDVHFGYTYAKMGRHAESRRILEKMLAIKDTQKGKASEIGIIYEGLGERDEAFAWFEKSIENREFGAVLLNIALWLDDLRRDPRFDELRKKIGLE